LVNGKRKHRDESYIAANCEGNQSPSRTVELRKKKKNNLTDKETFRDQNVDHLNPSLFNDDISATEVT
jgi:hypothetical protein